MKIYIFKTHLFRDEKILRDIEMAESKTKYPRVIKKLGQAPEQYPEIEE